MNRRVDTHPDPNDVELMDATCIDADTIILHVRYETAPLIFTIQLLGLTEVKGWHFRLPFQAH